MEKNVFIAKQFAIEEHEYTNRQGEVKKMASKGFIMTDGLDVFYAELTGTAARECGELDPMQYYRVMLEIRVSSWETQDHRKVYMNRIYVNRIRPITVTGKEGGYA